jgi:16S rRNA (cytosine967-C5)-methyltransferase
VADSKRHSSKKSRDSGSGHTKPAPAKLAGPPGLAARRLAVRLLRAVLVEHRPLDDAIARLVGDKAVTAMPPNDRAHARLIVTTTLRRLGQIDDLLGHFLSKPLPEERGALREILQTGAAQLAFLGTPPHAAVGLAVALAQADRQARHFDKLVNAVLRRVAEQAAALVAGQDAARLDTPDWLWSSWAMTYGEPAARRIAESHLEPPPLDLTVKSDPEEWARKLSGVALPTGSVRLRLEGRVDQLPGFTEGAWWVQDTAAALPVRLLGDMGGRRIADLCAAPGGKTAQLAQAGARVTAVDISAERLQRVKENLGRLGLAAEIVAADILAYRPEQPFDAVLLDAPCTATGTIRRHPDVARLKSSADVATLAALQARLLAHAAALVARGGRLVYCTCSLQPEEGPERIAAALSADSALRLDPLTSADLPPGGEAWLTPEGYLRTLPHHSPGLDPATGASIPGGMDGFFAARLLRTG